MRGSLTASGAVPRFLWRFEEGYRLKGKTKSIVASAAAHPRLLWIHPFLDGNGRVARLMSHVMMLDLLETGGIWSIARGLARSAGKYKELLANCDRTRRDDLDGRGNLNEEALVAFTRFFPSACTDQVTFMQGLMQPDTLRTRIFLWVEEEIRLGKLPAKSRSVLEAVLYLGELPKEEMAQVVGMDERQARRIVNPLLMREVLTSKGVRAPLRLAFPAALAHRWMPDLFPERTL